MKASNITIIAKVLADINMSIMTTVKIQGNDDDKWAYAIIAPIAANYTSVYITYYYAYETVIGQTKVMGSFEADSTLRTVLNIVTASNGINMMLNNA